MMATRLLRRLALALVVIGLSPVPAAGAAGDERARIGEERAAVESAWNARRRECATRFVVTACVEDAQRQRRAALAALRRQELVLDEAQRRERAAARLEHLDAKVRDRPVPVPRAHEAPEPKVPPAPREPRAPRASEPAAGVGVAPARITSPAKSPVPHSAAASRVTAPGTADRRQQEAARAAEFNARADAAKARREASERRQAERSAAGKTSRPLPPPDGAPAP